MSQSLFEVGKSHLLLLKMLCFLLSIAEYVLEWPDRNHTADIKCCFTHLHWWKWTEQSSEEQASHKTDLINKTRQSWHFYLIRQDPASSTTSEADSDTRENEPATLNYKPSPLHMKIGLSILLNANAIIFAIMYDYHMSLHYFFCVQTNRESWLGKDHWKMAMLEALSINNPRKITWWPEQGTNKRKDQHEHCLCFKFVHKQTLYFFLPSRLVVPNKGYSSLDQSPDEKPLVALDTDR